jgi:phosphoribosylformimino-5-aminoimidazole carboxamide ribotide isomerase
LLPLEAAGVIGVITGKALYSGAVSFADAMALARESRQTSAAPPTGDREG